MSARTFRLQMMSTTAALVLAGGVTAPARAADAAPDAKANEVQEVVVTGSRIRTTDVTTPAPVTIVNTQEFQDQGFVQAGQALNQITSIVPSVSDSGSNSPVLNQGQTFPNLFGLGANRTLTLMNGRRMPSTSTGLGGEETDTNIIRSASWTGSTSSRAEAPRSMAPARSPAS
jgi:outer membrane receptor protein involved in Fe transport